MTRRRRSALERDARVLLSRLATEDPGAHAELGRLGRELIQQAEMNGDHVAASIAWRVNALVERGRGDLDDAARSFHESVKSARAGGSDAAAAESRVSLAGLYAMSGQSDRALGEIEAALVVLEGQARARAVAQRGTILADLGRFDEALAAYAEALPVLHSARDTMGEIITLNSRSGVLLHLGRFAEAEADLLRGERHQRRLGGGGLLIDLLQNLSEVVAMRGDLPRALRYHDLALAEAGGQESPMAAAHRIDALLGARLVDEANEAAARALASHAIPEVLRPEIEVLAALASLLAGQPAVARERAAHADATFARQGRDRWSLLARQVGIRAELAALVDGEADRERSATAIDQARALARSLERSGWTTAAAETRLAAAVAALARNETGPLVRHDLEAASIVGAGAPASERLRAARADALLALVRNDQAGARRALRRGLGVLDGYRAALGATELRAHASAHGEGLALTGMRMAVADADPSAVLGWSERWRASTLHLRPVRPPDDAALADELASLRRVMAEIDHGTTAGSETSALSLRQRQLERSVRSRTRQAVGSGDDRKHRQRPLALADLRRRLDGRALVSFIEVDGSILALSVQGRRVSLVELGKAADVATEVEGIRFSLRRLARGGGSAVAREAARVSLDEAARRLDRLLFAPLAPVLGHQVGAGRDSPGDLDEPLVVVPAGPMHAVPWGVLPSCRLRPVTVAPSISFWCGARDGSPERDPSGALFVAGPDLVHAEAEIADLAEISSARATILVGPQAAAAAVCAALPRVELAHLACHGRFRSDSPMFSSLLLADGPLYVYDLERLGRTPPTIVLSACDSGLSAVRPGEELMGLAAVLLSLGTRSLIASVAPVPDDLTRTLMGALHRELAAGNPPPLALARARQAVTVAADGDPGLVAAAAFVCFGRSDSPPGLT